jgi:hypothetical protein
MANVWLATKTKAAINAAIAADNGNAYRGWLGKVLPHMHDAYATGEDKVRSHLGASIVGQACDRALAFAWLWVSADARPRGKKDEDPTAAHGRMLRLWNRGHLEEGRIIAQLLCAGVQIYQQDANGKQFRISDLGGHFSGSCDGVAMGVPDLPMGIPCLTEYKTHGEKSFLKLIEDGVRLSKPEHYIQMQMYMSKLGLQYALYFASNKNDDEIHLEIVTYDGVTDATYLERARSIIFADPKMLPPRINGASPAFFQCKYMCDHKPVCFHTVQPMRSCRSCKDSKPLPEGGWVCLDTGEVLDKAAQLRACGNYQVSPRFAAKRALS